jgi:predicted glycogen debranching enzyme
MTLRLGRDVCGSENNASKREWLVTNGSGGFACGTVANIATRHYHGLLVAALKPPLGRTVLVNKLDETAHYTGQIYPLFANRWATGITEPQGYLAVERFYLEGTTPVWRFALADALLEKRVWMAQGENTVYVRYDLIRASAPLSLAAKALVNYRSFHIGTHADNWQMEISAVQNGLCVRAFEDAAPFYLLSANATLNPQHTWYHNYYLSVEAYRGLDAHDDNLHAADFTAELRVGDTLTLVFSTNPHPQLDGNAAYQLQRDHEARLLRQSELPDAPQAVQQLVLAADQFIVRREVAGDPGRSVIAGYPWFGDWGRDTMISLAGLTLVTRRYDVARRILYTFGNFVDQGMLPNRFPDESSIPEYNTVDATLWYFEALRAYYAATQDRDLIESLFSVMKQIIDWHIKGTRYGIRVDPTDGLLRAGEPDVQLTWMDAKVNGWVVTPRTGKSVEVNALWYNALRTAAAFARVLGDGEREERYTAKAERVRESFQRFWNAETGWCYDVLDTPNGDDASLRPNQLFAVSLAHSPLDADKQRAVVDVCARHLLTSHGLRSLSPDDPAYVGSYGGNPLQRDSAYHQGTVWAWLMGAFVEAHLKAYGDKETARSFLLPLLEDHLITGCVGSISEIFDGDTPFTPRGAFAQAWSVAEVLRAWQLTAS